MHDKVKYMTPILTKFFPKNKRTGKMSNTKKFNLLIKSNFTTMR
jgi:hypothetical protein